MSTKIICQLILNHWFSYFDLDLNLKIDLVWHQKFSGLLLFLLRYRGNGGSTLVQKVFGLSYLKRRSQSDFKICLQELILKNLYTYSSFYFCVFNFSPPLILTIVYAPLLPGIVMTSTILILKLQLLLSYSTLVTFIKTL